MDPEKAKKKEQEQDKNTLSDEPWANGTADAFARTEEPFNESAREISDAQLDDMLGDLQS
ncbi:hypothetical protein [Deminuibacter soli]|uniref:Uncharacterized protein n=1 Tax=Deminuibacter soli TaxID=2291815 RepID=A0A3E1NJQ0_9BACT|nr:hypothetical protein [Deminuibacter soli]RFM28166.1 hypothetical protein DXN05_11630 [Deminuibacter soli]